MWFASFVIGLVGINAPSYAACNVVDGKTYGDCAGVRVIEGTKGHLTVRAPTSEAAIIDGATILKGGALELSGISNGDITVHRGGQVIIGGNVGSVSGEGAVSYKKGSVIGGAPLDRAVRKGGKQ